MEDSFGFIDLNLEDPDVELLLSDQLLPPNGLSQNEYLVARDRFGKEIGIYKMVGGTLRRVPRKDIVSRGVGVVKAKNTQQKLAIDMLYDRDTTIKVITGKFGSGKDYLMCSAAIDMLERQDFEKIIYVRNNVEVKNSKPIGHLPGSYYEKLLPFAMPMADHIGGADGLSMMMEDGRVEVVHLGFIRGRDLKNSIILCSEAENMTVEHIQLLIGRVGEGSSLWLNGDFKQVDADVFRKSSGLMRVVDRLKGHPRFAHVKLLKTERSETAAMADLLD